MEEKKVYGYVRVSTQEQKEDRQLIAMDEKNVPRENVYIDKVSGKDFVRPKYMELLKKLEEGTVLYIKSIDRLGRNYTEIQEQWRIITKEKQAEIVVIDMPLLNTMREKDLLGTLISDIVLVLLSYVAENERDSIRQRQAEGIAAAKAKGKKFGRPEIPLPDNFIGAVSLWKEGRASLKTAAKMCEMPKSTFYYKAKKVDE